MTKRAREDFLTPELLAEQLADDENGHVDNKEVEAAIIGERKIVKVKRHNQQTGQVTTEEGPKLGTFKLAGSLSTKAPEEKENDDKQTETKDEKGPAADEKPKGSLFGGDLPKFSFTVPTNGSLFGAKPADGEQQKPLFGGLNTIKPAEEKPATGNLFGSGSVLWKPASGGEFGGQKLEQAAASKPLFSFNKPKEEESTGGEKLFKPA